MFCRAYLHYQPSYYHLHVHFTNIGNIQDNSLSFCSRPPSMCLSVSEYNPPGVNCEKSHLLETVIGNIELDANYYRLEFQQHKYLQLTSGKRTLPRFFLLPQESKSGVCCAGEGPIVRGISGFWLLCACAAASVNPVVFRQLPGQRIRGGQLRQRVGFLCYAGESQGG